MSKVNTSSLLWRLASVYGPLTECDYVGRQNPHTLNVCQLVRAIAKGTFWWCVAMAAGMLYGAVTGSALAYIAAAIMTGTWVSMDDGEWMTPVGIGLHALVVVIFLLGVASVWWVEIAKPYLREKKRQRLALREGQEQEEQPSILMVWLKSIHDKVCINLTVTRDK